MGYQEVRLLEGVESWGLYLVLASVPLSPLSTFPTAVDWGPPAQAVWLTISAKATEPSNLPWLLKCLKL